MVRWMASAGVVVPMMGDWSRIERGSVIRYGTFPAITRQIGMPRPSPLVARHAWAFPHA
jgi:hypothetical protein